LRPAPSAPTKRFAVHRLVATAFHGEPNGSEQVRHLDGDKLNNLAENLTWGSQSENQKDRVLHGTSNRGERHGMHKLTGDQVESIRRDPRGTAVLASAYGVSRRHVQNIRAGKAWAWKA
jgi:hypothetical protein